MAKFGQWIMEVRHANGLTYGARVTETFEGLKLVEENRPMVDNSPPVFITFTNKSLTITYMNQSGDNEKESP